MRRAALVTGAGVAAVHWVPSVVSLGQWSPLRALPGGLCTWRGAPGRRAGDDPLGGAVALTFDDGPDPDSTPAFLDRLDELGLAGTFFCVGERVERHPEVVEEVARRGHEVASHGFSHEHHLLRSPMWVHRDTDRALGALAGAGFRPRWYRPPFGQVSGVTLAEARSRGLRLALWSAWGREWATRDAGAVAERIRRRLQPGAIVLLHDSDAFSPRGSSELGLSALKEIADELRWRRLSSVTLSQLVGPGST